MGVSTYITKLKKSELIELLKLLHVHHASNELTESLRSKLRKVRKDLEELIANSENFNIRPVSWLKITTPIPEMEPFVSPKIRVTPASRTTNSDSLDQSRSSDTSIDYSLEQEYASALSSTKRKNVLTDKDPITFKRLSPNLKHDSEPVGSSFDFNFNSYQESRPQVNRFSNVKEFTTINEKLNSPVPKPKLTRNLTTGSLNLGKDSSKSAIPKQNIKVFCGQQQDVAAALPSPDLNVSYSTRNSKTTFNPPRIVSTTTATVSTFSQTLISSSIATTVPASTATSVTFSRTVSNYPNLGLPSRNVVPQQPNLNLSSQFSNLTQAANIFII